MTKKHFIRAAEIVNGLLVSTEAAHAHQVARQVADAYIELFSAYNDRFDRQRFLVACGLAIAPVKTKRGKA